MAEGPLCNLTRVVYESLSTKSVPLIKPGPCSKSGEGRAPAEVEAMWSTSVGDRPGRPMVIRRGQKHQGATRAKTATQSRGYAAKRETTVRRGPGATPAQKIPAVVLSIDGVLP